MTSRSPDAIDIYDTTLRDGAQQEGINFSADDKLAVARRLDAFGVGFIEGGWPGANPRDTAFFARAKRELQLQRAVLVAFGSTRRAHGAAASDPLTRALLDAETPAVTLVAKAHPGHVERALRCSLAENLRMVEDTVRFLTAHGRRVFVDAEHFFDGYRQSADYARQVVRAAAGAGAEAVILCDTNGGMLPDQVGDVVAALADDAALGIHCHNDSGCAVANSLAAVAAGARQVQGTINGYGERTGNADLITVAGNLHLKLERKVSVDFSAATDTAVAVGDISGEPPHQRSPYVGRSAFTHKAGLHASALRVDPLLYQHIDPADAGNEMRTLISDMAGRASVELKAQELGISLDGLPDTSARIIQAVKDAEERGYSYEAADASFAVLVHRVTSGDAAPFHVTGWEVNHSSAFGVAEAQVTVTTDAPRLGRGSSSCPVGAVMEAMLDALKGTHPQINGLQVASVRANDILTADGSRVRVTVTLDSRDGQWSAVGVGHSQVPAALEALGDALTYSLGRRQSGDVIDVAA